MAPLAFDPRPIALRFWSLYGSDETFPRQLRGPVTSVLTVSIVTLPKLTLSDAANWLRRRGASISPPYDRPVRGFLVAKRGNGFIFLDGGLSPEEERVTLAHELAHFLHHYQAPRT